MFGNQAKLYEMIGRLTVDLNVKQGENQQLLNLLRAVADGSIDPLRLTVTDKGVQVAPILDESGEAAEV